MPSGTVIPAGGPPEAAPRPTRQDRAPGEPGAWRKYAITAGFLAPALVFLSVWLVYPTIRTVIRSFYDRSGDNFVGVDNYVDIFTTDILLTAIKNNILWVLVVPITITAIGVVFAVLTERIRWSVAFKTAVFMPMAISLFAAGLIWRIVYEQDPDRGVLNAAITSVRGIFVDDGQLAGAKPSGNELCRAQRGRRPQGHRSARGRCPDRADRDPDDGDPRRCDPGGEATAPGGGDQRRRLARLQAGRRQAGRGRAAGGRPAWGRRDADRRKRRQRRNDDDRGRVLLVRRPLRRSVHGGHPAQRVRRPLPGLHLARAHA